MRCGWECRPVQPLWKPVRGALGRPNICNCYMTQRSHCWVFIQNLSKGKAVAISKGERSPRGLGTTTYNGQDVEAA